MRQTFAITKKELSGAFGSPLALIFMGTFLLITLFVFFWVGTFFARGLADVRPLFTWMPLLLVFLVAALTMRQWSEEQRAGTLEMLMTLPVDTWRLVIGKFLAVMTLVLVALALTLCLPITVALLGNLDWGPVLGGYLAALLMAAAYAAIGLFVSSRTDNQIVALILTLLIGGALYLIGTSALLDFVPVSVAAVFRSLSTTTHFASIERGVLDLRDLIYYLSLAALFLTLNVLSLDSKRWSHGALTRPYRNARALGVVLVAVNLVLLNGWLSPLAGLRADMTQNHVYTLSPTTKDLLASAQEPLLIRAYMSKNTHPLLAPLIPQVADMLHEYAAASGGRVKAEVVDPATDSTLEAEANQTYGIQPTPFQVANRYESSVVNAYFDILVRYGDQSQVLKLSDLVSVKSNPDGSPDVELNSLEYNLTRAVKKVVAGFSDVNSLLASLPAPAKLTLLVTPATLPAALKDGPDLVKKVTNDIGKGAEGRLSFEQVDPTASGSSYTPQDLAKDYGIQPIPVSLLSPDRYYFQMLLSVGDHTEVVVPAGTLSDATVKDAITSALKRSTSGFVKVVGVWTPPQAPTTNAFGQQQPQIYQASRIQQQLQRDYKVEPVTLSDGTVPNDIDSLLVLSPQGMTDDQRFAVDQFLMRGGSVIVAGGSYALTTDPYTGGMAMKPTDGGLADMLAGYGVKVDKALVLDAQNAPFPVVVPRMVGGRQIREIQAIDYPFFVNVRPDGMDASSPVSSNLPEVIMPWASPLELTTKADSGIKTDVLLSSSPKSWSTTDTTVIPDFDKYPSTGFAPAGTTKSYPLAVSLTGSFSSYFNGKPNPLLAADTSADASKGSTADASKDGKDSAPKAQLGVLSSSPDGARLVVIGSGEVVNDTVLNLSAQLGQDRSGENLALLQNAVDWSVADADLLAIRSRGNQTRVLRPLAAGQETIWEVANYAAALILLLLIAAVWRWRSRHRSPMIPPDKGGTGDRVVQGVRS